MAKKLIQAMVVLFILLGEIVNAEPVRAAEMISCDANGKCVVRLDYYGTLYNENIEHGFDQLGQGTNSWPIPAGGAAQSFGARIGNLGGSDYHNLQKPDGSSSACSIVYYFCYQNIIVFVIRKIQFIANPDFSCRIYQYIPQTLVVVELS